MRLSVAPLNSLAFRFPEFGSKLARCGLAHAGCRSILSVVFDELADRFAAKASRYRLSRRLPFVTQTGRLNTPRYKRPEPLAFFIRSDFFFEGIFVLTRRMERPQNQRWKALTQVMARCNDPLLSAYLRPILILIKHPNRGTLE